MGAKKAHLGFATRIKGATLVAKMRADYDKLNRNMQKRNLLTRIFAVVRIFFRAIKEGNLFRPYATMEWFYTEDYDKALKLYTSGEEEGDFLFQADKVKSKKGYQKLVENLKKVLNPCLSSK